MDPVTMAAISGLVSIGGGAIANWLASSSDRKELEQRELALQQYAALAPPEHRDLIARTVARTRMEDVNRDQGLEAVQDEALARTLDVARNGESARTRADYEQAALDSAQAARSARMSAVANAEALGLGPEAAFTDSLMAGQGDADRERMAGLLRAANSEDARRAAVESAGGMAAARSATRWGQDAEVAQAQDDLARFNAGQWQQTDQFNRQGEFNSFQARLAQADRIANQRNEIGDTHRTRGERTRRQAGDVIGGAGRAIQAPATYGGQSTTAPKTSPYQANTYGGVGAQAALDPALEQQRKLQQGQPLATNKTRRLR